MPLRIAACVSVAAALLAVPAGAHAASVVRPSSVHGTTILTAGAHTISLECPSPSVALNAAVTRKSPGVTVRRSIPGDGAGDWSFRVSAASGGSRVRSVLRCVRLTPPAGVSGAQLEVKTRSRSGVRVSAGGTATVRLRCGPGWLATGYGFDDRRGNLRFASVVPSARGWDFVIENTGSAAAPAAVGARCLRQTVSTAGGSELSFGVTRPSRMNILGTRSTQTLAHGCGTGRFSLATGSVLDPTDTIELAGTGPTRPQWGRWTFQQVSGGDRVQTFLVCLSRGSGFN